MENQKVVIRIIEGGQKKYVTNIQPSSYSFRTSKNPFGDTDVLKLDLNTAMDFAKKHSSFYRKVQVIDINGNNLFNSVGDVINEEVQKFLNESFVLEDENFKFRQEIKSSSFYNYDTFSNDFDVDINESDIFVNWHIGFWLNDFGVEHYYVKVDSVDGTYKVGLLNKQTDEMEQENDKNIAEFQWKFVVPDATLRINKTLYIDTLDFDFKTKICRVTFFDSEE